MFERSMLYDWCICDGEYDLTRYSERMMPMMLKNYLSDARLQTAAY